MAAVVAFAGAVASCSTAGFGTGAVFVAAWSAAAAFVAAPPVWVAIPTAIPESDAMITSASAVLAIGLAFESLKRMVHLQQVDRVGNHPCTRVPASTQFSPDIRPIIR